MNRARTASVVLVCLVTIAVALPNRSASNGPSERFRITIEHTEFPTVEGMLNESTAVALVDLESPLLEAPVEGMGGDGLETVWVDVAQRAHVIRTVSGQLPDTVVILGSIVNLENSLVKEGRVSLDDYYPTELLAEGHIYVAFLRERGKVDRARLGLPADAGPIYYLVGMTTGLIQVDGGEETPLTGDDDSLADLPLASPHLHGVAMELPSTLGKLLNDISAFDQTRRQTRSCSHEPIPTTPFPRDSVSTVDANGIRAAPATSVSDSLPPTAPNPPHVPLPGNGPAPLAEGFDLGPCDVPTATTADR